MTIKIAWNLRILEFTKVVAYDITIGPHNMYICDLMETLYGNFLISWDRCILQRDIIKHNLWIMKLKGPKIQIDWSKWGTIFPGMSIEF